jgi:ABC-type uncharacterized transport system permease subunit
MTSERAAVVSAPHGKPTPEPGQEPLPGGSPETGANLVRRLTTGPLLSSALAVLLSFLVGAVLICITDERVTTAISYAGHRPGDLFAALWDAVAGSYGALFAGSVYNPGADGFADGIRPLTETLTFATPLIAAGLGVALAFRVGMFNIGARGQILVAAACAGWVGSSLHLPIGIHLVVAVAAGLLGGALWGGVVGLLKARTGAHEVILTIMLNYVAFYLISYLLRTPVLQVPGSANPRSRPMLDSATLPPLFGSGYNTHMGFLLAVVATAGIWWLLNRSSTGFRFRAVGLNPHAARVAGIDVGRVYLLTMLMAGGLAGLAGASQVLGTVTTGFGSSIEAGIGFEAITVALLGRSRPVGVFFAGLLFGAFKAGGFAMQARAGIPVDIVLVLQSLIVLFIAAPPLVRAIFRLRSGAAREETAR